MEKQKVKNKTEFKEPSVYIMLLARIIDILLSSVPMILIYIFLKVESLQSALILFFSFNFSFFIYFILLPYLLKGNTIGKFVCLLRLKNEGNKNLFLCILRRELYFLYIPFIVQTLLQIVALLFFRYYQPGNSDMNSNGWKIAVIIQNLGNTFLAIWFFYLVITIYLSPKKRSAIDAKLNIKIYSLKFINQNQSKKYVNVVEENYIPGVINMNELIENKSIEFKKTENLIQGWVENSFINGAVIKIQKGKSLIYENVFGYNNLKEKTLMKSNTIFKGYSITKMLTAIGTLILADKNLISLNDEVSKYLPWFKNMKVYENGEIKEAKNKIKIYHLLTMTSGLVYGGKTTQSEHQTEKLLLKIRNKEFANDEFMKMVCDIPLEFEPGTSWKYGISYDVLSALIEKAIGSSFRNFIKENILDRLNMNDTDFYMIDKLREACVYKVLNENEKNKLIKLDNFNYLLQDIEKVPNISMGGSGIFTTCEDYFKFLKFLLTGNDKNNVKLLSDEMLIQMRSDQVHLLKKFLYMNINEDYSYGYGVRVRLSNQIEPLTSIGQFGWDGLLGSSCIVDPKNELIVCFMTSVKQKDDKIVKELSKAIYEDINMQ